MRKVISHSFIRDVIRQSVKERKTPHPLSEDLILTKKEEIL